jgi:hypothetical protein
LKIEYGESDFSTHGFGIDISTGGVFVTATKLLPPGTRIHMKISLGTAEFYAEGRVVRQKLVHPNLRSSEPQGMGVRFISPSEIIERAFPAPKKAPKAFAVGCSAKSSLDDLIRDQLSRGVIVVPVGVPSPEVQSAIEFEVTLDFLPEPQTLKGTGRVVQLLTPPAGSGSIGAVVMVDNAAELVAALQRGGA